MAGNGDEADEGWLDQMVELLKRATDQCVQCLAEAGPPADVAEAERRARAAGVIARSAKAIVGLRASAKSLSRERQTCTDEEEMSDTDRDITDAELAGLKSEFFARLDRLVSGLESKALAEGLDRGVAARGSGEGAGLGAEPDAGFEPSAGLAA